jgi:hypothetical protein
MYFTFTISAEEYSILYVLQKFGFSSKVISIILNYLIKSAETSTFYAASENLTKFRYGKNGNDEL